MTNLLTQIKDKEAQIAQLNNEINTLKEQLLFYIMQNPQTIMNNMLGVQSSKEVVPTTKKTNIIVSIKFNKNSNKTYDYLYVDTEPVKIGDIVVVETPYKGHQDLEVVAIKNMTDEELDNAPYTYKEARLSIMPLWE